MDIATIAGIFMGFGLVLGAIILGGSLGAFIDVLSMMIVIGGSLGATIASTTMENAKTLPGIVKNAFFSSGYDLKETVSTIVSFAEKARREGLLSLEDSLVDVSDEFLKKGIQLVVDGTDPELVKNILDTEVAFLEERHRAGKGLMDTLASMAPAFGMLGTLIGLIQMLGHLNDPSMLGPGMAVALITTFYGSLIANVIAIPIANKLALRSGEEILIKQMIIEGILSIQSGENPRIVVEKLKVFLPPKVRASMEEQEKAEEGG